MNNEELKHYGVPGMKWGHRKNTSMVSANKAYKKAAKDERKAKIGRLFKKETYLAGYENRKKDNQNKANVKKLSEAREKAAFKVIDKQAKYAYDKKLAKTGDKAKAEKASMKVHAKAMSKDKYGSGLVGSIADAKTGGNTRYYKHMMTTKGKKYASSVEKMYSKKINRTLIASAAVLVGTTLVPAVIDRLDRR